MRIEILGTRANVAARSPGHTRHAGVLVGASILLDLGEMTYLERRPRHVFISHLHPDHAAFLVAKRVPNVTLHVPESSPLAPDARIIRRAVRVGAYRVVPVPTEHAVNARSVGFVVERGRHRMFYSSDMIAIPRRQQARLGRLDLVITDGSFMRRGGLVRVDPRSGRRFGHAGIPDLVEFFSRFTRRIVLTHFGSWFYRDIAGAVRRISSLGDGVRVSAARDGQRIDL